MVEIKEKDNCYYCDIRELPQDQESIQQGDKVEFISIPDSFLAISIVKMKPLLEDSGIVFKRNPINAVLKQTQVNTGHRGIIMAQGPPNDTSVGFETAWRGEFYLKDFTLPWTHILSNLPSTSN